MHTHLTQRHNVCTDCGAKLCTHHHHSLRGCMLDAGHEGPHFNPNAHDDFHWADADGRYVNSQADWETHLDNLLALGRANDPKRFACA